jgi:hypothetical protein
MESRLGSTDRSQCLRDRHWFRGFSAFSRGGAAAGGNYAWQTGNIVVSDLPPISKV